MALMVPSIIVLHGFGGLSGTDESAVKAMFIYNFAKYFDWSRIESKPEFVIAVYGNTKVAKYLDEISHRKTINGKPIVIRTIFTPAECAGAQMLFLPDHASNLSEILQMFSGNNSIVIITENEEAFRKGSHINLINVDGKLRFELNETRMKNNSIKYSKELTSLSVKPD